MKELPFRQAHLDFHTSPLIPDVGELFNPKEFVLTLAEAAVNSITVFSKCHHGLSYHPTQVGQMHPGLKRDLLGEMIEACHEKGIRVPIYISVVWDEFAGTNHPEWLQVGRDGRIVGRGPLENGWGWKWLCLNTPYLDYLVRQTKEVMTNYPVDGVFFDIVFQTTPGCVCPTCLSKMKAEGVNPENDEELSAYSLKVVRAAMARLYETVKTHHPEAAVFFNGRCRVEEDVEKGIRPELPYQTHIEIESLPSGGWGYSHFQLFARHYQTFDKELVGMTGRFHKSWADFGGMKNQAALEYEVFTMLANGAKCSIGDQLHPSGKIDKGTYELIGRVYRSVRDKEPWCCGVQAVKDIAVYLVNDGWQDRMMRARGWSKVEGALKMLMEDHRQFQVIDGATDFQPYRLIIFPDIVRFNDELAQKVRNYLQNGGKILLTYQSGLKHHEDSFALEEFGLRYEGQWVEVSGEYFENVEYLRIGDKLLNGLIDTDYVIYHPGSRVRAVSGESLAYIGEPYFNRRWNHFMSHKQTPISHITDFPGAVLNGNVLYFAHPLFGQYQQHGNLVFKKLITNGINLLLGEPLVDSNLPSTAHVTLMEQSGRYILHLLHYVPQRRADIDIIEDVIPLYDVGLSVRLPIEVKRVYLAPQQEELPFRVRQGRIEFSVPRLEGHQMVVIE